MYWIDAESSLSLDREYKNLAEKFDISISGQKIEQIRELVKEKLKKLKNWLLIFDNVESYRDLKKYIPDKTNNHHILITSRINKVPTDWQMPIKLPVLCREDSIKLISQYLIDNDKQTDNEFKSLANNLADKLGDLPLALVQASAFIGRNGNISEYIKIFEDMKFQLLKDNPPSDYHATVMTTWQISINKIIENDVDKLALKILNISSYLAPDYIPKSLLIDFIFSNSKRKTRNHAQEEYNLKKAINLLCEYCLIDQSNNFIFIHQLLQEITIISNFSRQNNNLLKKIINITSEKFIFQRYNKSTCETCQVFFPHISKIIDHANKKKFSHLDFVKILNQFGNYIQHQQGLFDQADRLFNQSLSILNQKDNMDENIIYLKSEIYLGLGRVYWDKGDFKKGLEKLLSGLKEIKKVKKNNETFITNIKIEIYIYMVLTYWGQENYKKSREACEKAESILNNELITNKLYLEKARLYSTLGWAHAGENITEAINYFSNSDKLWNDYDSQHPDRAIALNGLGWMEMGLKSFDQVERHFKQAITIRRKYYKKNHPNLAFSYHGIGRIYLYKSLYKSQMNEDNQKEHNLKKANTLLNLALNIRTEFIRTEFFDDLDDNDLDDKYLIACPNVSIALVKLEENNIIEAEEKLIKATKYFQYVDKTVYNHDLGEYYYACGKYYIKKEVYDKARDFLEKALACYEKSSKDLTKTDTEDLLQKLPSVE